MDTKKMAIIATKGTSPPSSTLGALLGFCYISER